MSYVKNIMCTLFCVHCVMVRWFDHLANEWVLFNASICQMSYGPHTDGLSDNVQMVGTLFEHPKKGCC